MAFKKQVLILLLSLFTVSWTIKSSQAADCPAYSDGGAISVYWGQSNDFTNEGTLTEACDTGNYNIVILAYLHVYGSTTPSLDFGGHCPSGDCTQLAQEIRYCQNKGIHVLLSLQVNTAGFSPTDLATYLWENFLSSSSGSSPLGSVALDGIDFANINGYSSSVPWEELATAIKGSTQDRNIYLSAAPRCDARGGLASTIAGGLFDYLWVLYYNEYAQCQYLINGNPTNLLNSWEDWTSSVPSNTSVFLGVVASDSAAAASSGYIPPGVLKSDILPTIKEASNYGGVMIWNRFFDKQTDYSGQIKDALGTKVCECVCREAVSRGFHSLLAQSVY